MTQGWNLRLLKNALLGQNIPSLLFGTSSTSHALRLCVFLRAPTLGSKSLQALSRKRPTVTKRLIERMSGPFRRSFLSHPSHHQLALKEKLKRLDSKSRLTHVFAPSVEAMASEKNAEGFGMLLEIHRDLSRKSRIVLTIFKDGKRDPTLMS